MAIVNIGGKLQLADSVANIDNKYGPYTSTQAAFDYLGPDNLDVLAIGLTVGIQATPTSPITEYWFKEACDSVEDLVPKLVAGSTDYTDLENKPSINGITLEGNKETSDLGIFIPTKLSELTNDNEFITNTVDDLTNYYLKTETYTQDEVEALIGQIKTTHFEIVTSLPAIGEGNIIYLISKDDQKETDIYDEYIYINNKWELIGNTQIDLSNYYNKTETDELLEDKQDGLISGTNIKTINNQSILGSGNIEIQSGSPAPTVENEILIFATGSSVRVEGEEVIF